VTDTLIATVLELEKTIKAQLKLNEFQANVNQDMLEFVEMQERTNLLILERLDAYNGITDDILAAINAQGAVIVALREAMK